MIAVTGANGLLGSFIVRKLLERNVPFIALKRSNSDLSLLEDVGDRITWRLADVMDPVGLEEAFAGVTQVIHAAAVVSFNPRRAGFIMDQNVLGTRHVVNECLSRGVKRLLHVSSVAALGRQKSQRIVDETNQWVDSPMNTVYAKSKYLAELEVYRAQEEGVSTVIVNPSVVLAPGDWHKSSAKIFRYVWKEKKFFADAYLNYVDVRDVADVTVRLLDSEVSGQRFILSAGNIHVEELFRKIAKRFGKRPPHIRLSPPLLNMLARLETWRTGLTKAEPLITLETARLAGSEFHYDNAKIRKTLSIDFQPIDETLDWCCRYYLTKTR